jgi:ribonuclease G
MAKQRNVRGRKTRTPGAPKDFRAATGAPRKEIIVNVSNRETRIALLEDNELMEYRVEREERVVGSIFKGIVQNVLPGMDAAFVDIGLERNAYLSIADVLPEESGNDNSPANSHLVDYCLSILPVESESESESERVSV